MNIRKEKKNTDEERENEDGGKKETSDKYAKQKMKKSKIKAKWARRPCWVIATALVPLMVLFYVNQQRTQISLLKMLLMLKEKEMNERIKKTYITLI